MTDAQSESLRATIAEAGWRINVERPEVVTREGDTFTVEPAHYSASKETRPVSVAGSLAQLVDVCLGSDAAVASRKPEPVAPEVVVVPAAPTLEDLAEQVRALEAQVAASQDQAA